MERGGGALGVVMEANQPRLGAVLDGFVAELALELGNLRDERRGHVRRLEKQGASHGCRG